MGPDEIARRRLHEQGISRASFRRPEEVVRWLAGVQAQDWAAAKWALGLRMRAAVDADVERAFDEGSILRTHVLRPTWHFVTAADIRWMLDLTAPRVKAALAGRHRRLGLDAGTLKRSRSAIEKALRDGAHRTRDELRAALESAGIAAGGVRMAHILASVELDGLVCSGPRRVKRFTYALLDERVPPARPRKHDEALAELAGRYFRSRGPATVQDFAKWSGLTVADGRRGAEALGRELRHETVDGRTYWLRRASRPRIRPSPTAFLLPVFDEYVSGYKDRSAVVKPAHAARLTANALANLLVLDGRIVGTWRRAVRRAAVTVDLRPFDPLTRSRKWAVAAAADRYAAFLGLPVALAPVD